MWKLSLAIVLCISMNSNAQSTIRNQENSKKPALSIFGNCFFVKAGVGITSAQVDEWESTVYPTSTQASSGLGGGSWFGGSSSPKPQYHYNSVRRKFTTVSFKVGNRWVFGSNKIWRPGVQLTWFKYTAFVPVNEGDFKRSFSFPMLGFTNTFKLEENSALEFNGGYGISFTKNNLKGEVNPRSKGLGLSYDLELNYRYKSLSVGFDFSSIYRGDQLTTDWSSLNTFGLSVGIVF